MAVQLETRAATGTCPRGFHECSVRWQCPHGYEFLRHTPAGKYQTSSAGPQQGSTPCPDCTEQSEAAAHRVSDAFLMAELEEALGLGDDRY